MPESLKKLLAPSLVECRGKSRNSGLVPGIRSDPVFHSAKSITQKNSLRIIFLGVTQSPRNLTWESPLS